MILVFIAILSMVIFPAEHKEQVHSRDEKVIVHQPQTEMANKTEASDQKI